MRIILYLILWHWFFNVIFKTLTGPEIEKLVVSIEGDFSNLLSQANEGVEETKDKLSELDDAGQRTGGSLKSSAGVAGLAFGLAAGAAAKLLDVVLQLAVSVPQFFANLGKQAIAANAQFEAFAVQFETLLGSAGAARSRLEELARFGVETPFELPEVISASRTLQVFGGTALATGDNLRLIGDIAAGVNQPFQSVAFWIGRMFDALQNGQPFGEAALRLQEMGALSGDTRREMERLQKAGADGNEIFTLFSDQVGGKFAGNMERLSKTFQGVQSNLTDFRENLIRVAGEPFFEEIRDSAIAFLDLLNENEDLITDIASGIGELAASVIRLGREGFEGINLRGFLEKARDFITWLTDASKATLAFIVMFGRFAGALLGPGIKALFGIQALFDKLLLSIPLVGDAIRFLRDMWGRLDEALITAAQILAFAEAGVKGITASLAPMIELLKLASEVLVALINRDFATAGQKANQALDLIKDGLIDLDAGAQAAAESFLESGQFINDMIAPIEDVEEAFDDAGDAAGDMADQVEDSSNAILEKLDGLANQMIDAIERRDEQLAKLESDHAEKVLDIMADANKKRLDIEERYSDDLAKLAKDTEDKRLKIIADTREQLAKLATDTDKQLSQRRKDFNRDELRETEDHLRDMRRLEEDFLLNLEDAVRERDARAIVDLERRFTVESQRKEEDFQVDQSRGQEDFSAELDQIRNNEAERRNEILAAQSQALEDLRVHEEEKRIELDERRIEGLEKLQENLNERLVKENQNYLERQQALEQALQNQLQAIARNLADEKDVTEEGARQILDTFNEYFGIGGNIDQLMEQFSRRRRIRADIQVEFSGPTSSPGSIQGGSSFASSTNPFAPIPTFQHGGSMIATRPTLAMFGEGGPELAQFTPLSQLSNMGSRGQKLEIEFSGSAPPGIGLAERDQIASTLLSALRDAGALTEG